MHEGIINFESKLDEAGGERHFQKAELTACV